MEFWQDLFFLFSFRLETINGQVATCPCSTYVQLLALSLSLSLSLSFHGLCTHQSTSYLKELRIGETNKGEFITQWVQDHLDWFSMLYTSKKSMCKAWRSNCILGQWIKLKKVHATSIVPKEKIFPFTEQIWNLRRKTEHEQHLLSPCPQPKKKKKKKKKNQKKNYPKKI